MLFIKKLLHVLYRVRSLFLLLCTLVITALYTVLKKDTYYPCPDDDPNSIDYFPLVCIEVYPDTHLFFITMWIAWIFVSIQLLCMATEFITAYKIYLLIHVVTLVDYLLIYGQTWFYYLGELPVNYNIIKVLIFALTIIIEVIKELDT